MPLSRIEIEEPYINGISKITHDDKNYYLKIGDPSDIHKEILNYSIAHCFLQDMIDISVPEVISLDLSHHAMITPDYGDTFDKQVQDGHSAKISIYRVCDLIVKMSQRGILWGGFVPQNLFLNKHGKFRGMNFEDFYCFRHPIKEIPSLNVMKWSFEWEGNVDSYDSSPEIYEFIGSYLNNRGITNQTLEKPNKIIKGNQHYDDYN